jgi:hypothetical protein
MSRETFSKIFFHLLLAAFTALAANKFFTLDLEYEETYHFYQRIFEWKGDAPDQYRILPLLALKGIRYFLPFHHSVLLLNFACTFLLFECFFILLNGRSEKVKIYFNLGFAVLFIYTQYTGWRPDTLALLLICSFTVVWVKSVRNLPLRDFGLITLLIALSFSRADMAMIYALFFGYYALRNWPLRILAVLIPVGIQLLLQQVLFPNASYYTHFLMISDNLHGFYLVMNPGTWLLVAVGFIFRKEFFSFLQMDVKKNLYFYIVFTIYLLLIFTTGRLNEYRLYLPFVPLFLLLHGASDGKEEARNF